MPCFTIYLEEVGKKIYETGSPALKGFPGRGDGAEDGKVASPAGHW